MFPGLMVKLRPTTPWRIAPESGARDSVDSLYRSDSLYSAVTLAMRQLGRLDDWLAATALSDIPAVRFSCCYPFYGNTTYIVPPRNLWPPPPTSRVRWKSARYVPISVVEKLVNDPEARLRDEEGWVVDPESECLLPASPSGKQYGPFRTNRRAHAAVDRFTGVAADAVHTACIEFAPNAGLWCLAVFASEDAEAQWAGPLAAAFRLLADTGFGGQRSRGWGRAADPDLQFGRFPDLLMQAPEIPEPVEPPAPSVTVAMAGEDAPAADPSDESSGEPQASAAAPPPPPSSAPPPVETAYWLLSLFSPGQQDSVDWDRGAYSILDRNGHTDLATDSPSGTRKRSLRMVAEGSVLLAHKPLRGAAPNVAPDQHPHAVYRSGFALAIPIAWRVVA